MVRLFSPQFNLTFFNKGAGIFIMKKFLLSTAISIASISLMAEDLPYNTLSLDYLSPENGNGFGLRGNVEISDSFFLAGSYSRVENDIPSFTNSIDITSSSFTAGLGYHVPVSKQADFVGTVSYVNLRLEVDDTSDSEGGFGLGAGIRYKPIDSIELIPSISYVSVSDINDFSLGAEARYFFVEKVSIGAGYTYGFDSEAGVFNVGFRVDF